MEKKNYVHVWLTAIITGMCGILFGFDTGIIADAHWQISAAFQITSLQWSIIVSATVLGAFMGSLCCGWLSDFLGRKQCLFIVTIGFFIGTLTAGFANQVSLLILGRFVIGLCIGIASFTAPLYISEIAPAEKRGQLVLLNSVGITAGECLAFLIGYYLEGISPHSWRLMILSGLLPAVVLFVGLFYLPASPRWLACRGRLDQARSVLLTVRTSHDMVEQEIVEMMKTINQESKAMLQLLWQKPIRQVMALGLSLAFFQQICGINIVMYYGPYLFSKIGYQNEHALLATCLMGFTNMVFTIIALFLVDKLGRRKLYISGASTAAAAMGLLTLSSWFGNQVTWLPLLSLLVFIMAFAVSLGCIFWLIITELYPMHIRGLAMSIVTSFQWLTNFAVALTFPILFEKYGQVLTFSFLTAACLFAAMIAMIYMPETTGMSLENIERRLNKGISIRYLGKS